jgi:hypothetical protein
MLKKIDNSLDLLQPLSNRLTLQEIKEWLKNTFGITVCIETVRKLFKKLKLKRKKPQFSFLNANKDDQDRFVLLMNALLNHEDVKNGSIDIYFHDETTIRETPTKSDVWAYEGTIPLLPITGGHLKRIISGVIDIRTGDAMFVSDRKFNQLAFLSFLEDFKNKRNGKPTILVIDNYPSHLTDNVKKFYKEEESWLTIINLPKYSPDFNPIEYIWKYIKGKCCANRYYENFETKLDAVYDELDFLEFNAQEVRKQGSTIYYQVC